MEMGMKGNEEEGIRKWDDMGPMPINHGLMESWNIIWMKGLLCHSQLLWMPIS